MIIYNQNLYYDVSMWQWAQISHFKMIIFNVIQKLGTVPIHHILPPIKTCIMMPQWQRSQINHFKMVISDCKQMFYQDYTVVGTVMLHYCRLAANWFESKIRRRRCHTWDKKINLIFLFASYYFIKVYIYKT